MHHLSMKNWKLGIHMPNVHDLVTGLDNLIHDEHFWQIVYISSLIAMLMMFDFWSGSPAY